ncbi:MAG TPA: aspartate aminotransferase family protein, partial [Edaphobacter sp.]|nr:aspartate aminotransferase family protein [Edaphobacter sp.]
PQLDIVFYAVRSPHGTTEASSVLAQRVFDAAAKHHLHLALATLPVRFFPTDAFSCHADAQVTCLRSVMMKPEHLAWMDQIWQRLDAALIDVVQM